MVFCGNCGTELTDDAMFCLNCGSRVQQAEAQTSTSQPGSDSFAQKAKGPNKKPIIIAAIIIVCVAVALIVGIFANAQAQKHAKTHAEVAIPITINFSNEGANDPIGVPFVIQGTDLDNNHVEQRYLSPASGGTAELKAGSYTVTVAGPTPNKSGQVYKDQTMSTYTLEIPTPAENDDDQAQAEEQPGIDVTLAPVLPQDLTEDDIEGMREWMEEFDVDPNEISETIEAVNREHDKEVARINLEKEKQAALNANPSVLNGHGTESLSQVTLTGTVKRDAFYGEKNTGPDDLTYLQLSHEVKADNVLLHGRLTSGIGADMIMLDDSFSQYIGKTVSVSGELVVQFTRMPACSYFFFIDAHASRVF